ncbi:MAG: DUF502 domain-containing protein [Thermoguttaceae bacterium]|jgi:uncharacterized membrane protein|nr:DUF502 domain-containing protein [Thermoguttaceae bacterium]
MIFRPIIRFFLAGVFAVLPLVITVAAVIWVAGFFGQLVGPGTLLGELLRSLGLQVATDKTMAYIVGWVLVLGLIFLLGVLVEAGARRLIFERLDAMANHVPLVGGVYGTARQLVSMMDKKKSADLQGMRVVFCQFGKETGAAFLALLPTPESFRIGDVDYHAVLIPSAPVPVGGSLIFVPTSSVVPANLSVDAFMSIYVSMGVTGPQFLPLPRTEEESA